MHLLRFCCKIFIVLSMFSVIIFVVLMSQKEKLSSTVSTLSTVRHVWFTFTRAGINSPLSFKLERMLESMLINSPNVKIHFNVISDVNSRGAANYIIDRVTTRYYKKMKEIESIVTFYDVEQCVQNLNSIIKCLTPHFSSKPGSYYSDSLFYLSLGLHHIAPEDQKHIVSLDCDLQFESNIEYLFQEFERFIPSNLYGLAYELSPVYRHVLYNYRAKYKNTSFGSDPRENNLNNDGKMTKGFPGYNSGVILLNLERIRKSKAIDDLLKCDYVDNLTAKYTFKGHLGDQDFFTLLGYEKPELFYTLDCTWNTQLCKWWRRNIDPVIFDKYFKCDSPAKIYHGNCNTPFPDNQDTEFNIKNV